ncbi:MAG: PAS domain S-box protein [Gammaproteobacteria bacterium]|nr:PAS domain S-box protein [Gammaproteobacteria bacterium]
MQRVGTTDLKGGNFKKVLTALQQIDDVIHLDFPILRNEKTLAHVVVGLSKQRLEAEARAAAWQQSVLNGLIIVFLSGCLYLVFRHHALRPIRALALGSQRVAGGDLATPVELYSGDELGHLSTAFNDMMQRLALTLGEKDQALHSLHDLNKSLEERVAQRTVQLERSETRMRAIFESMGEGIITLNPQGYVISMNPAAERIFAVRSRESEGIHSALLLADAHTEELSRLDSYDESKNAVFQISSSITPGEYQGRAFNGREFPMELMVTAMQLGDENLRVCILRDITRRKETEARLAAAQQQLVDAAHKSGMAEIAIGVLHNVGNILNSVMLSGEEIARVAKNSKVAGLNKANELLRSNAHDLGNFFTTNGKGKMLPQYYEKIGAALSEETKSINGEALKLNEKLAMIKDVIATQQAYARADAYTEQLDVVPVIEDALRVQEASLRKLGVTVRKDFKAIPRCAVHKSKFLQVLTNLIKNAKEATLENDKFNRIQEIVLETGRAGPGDVFIKITDNGCGIAAENLQRIFNHGFTTKENGHGFGLHTSALAMTEMGGSLSVHSAGLGYGATFTLLVPSGQAKVAVTPTADAARLSAA